MTSAHTVVAPSRRDLQPVAAISAVAIMTLAFFRPVTAKRDEISWPALALTRGAEDAAAGRARLIARPQGGFVARQLLPLLGRY